MVQIEQGAKRIKSYTKYRILKLLQSGGMTVNEIADNIQEGGQDQGVDADEKG